MPLPWRENGADRVLLNPVVVHSVGFPVLGSVSNSVNYCSAVWQPPWTCIWILTWGLVIPILICSNIIVSKQLSGVVTFSTLHINHTAISEQTKKQSHLNVCAEPYLLLFITWLVLCHMGNLHKTMIIHQTSWIVIRVYAIFSFPGNKTFKNSFVEEF